MTELAEFTVLAVLTVDTVDTVETVETVETEDLKKYHSLTHSLTKKYHVLLTANMDSRDASASKNPISSVRSYCIQ